MATFNINNADVVKLTNKLEKLHRSAMPIAVRQTFNDAAFETRRGLIKQFKKNFIIRNRTFINAHAGVNKSANTFNLDQMKAEAGVIHGKTKSGDLLEKQEVGGNIQRARIPSKNVRFGTNFRKPVMGKYYYKKFKNRPNGVIYKSGESTIIKTDKSLFRIMRGGKIVVMYTLNKSIRIQAEPFVKPASEKAANMLPDFFLKNAQKRFEKYLK